MGFGPIDGTVQNLKTIIRVMESLLILIDRVHQVLLGIRIRDLAQVPEQIGAGNTFDGILPPLAKVEKLIL